MPNNNKTLNKQSDSSNNNAADEIQPLTYKAWKVLKDSQNKTPAKSQNERRNSNDKYIFANAFSRIRDERNIYNYNSFNTIRAPIVQCYQNYYKRSGFMPSSIFSGMNNFGRINNSSSFYRTNNFGDYKLSNKLNSYESSNLIDSRGLTNNFGTTYKGNNFDLPCSFFSSDGIYRQKDMMQKPLPNNNVFRSDSRTFPLLKEIDRSRYTEFEKKKAKEINKLSNVQRNNSSNNDMVTDSGGKRNLCNEPKVYVPNPQAKIDGKPYIPKPKIPEQNTDISKEQKKQQWKEYRDAMKPFKNREFYNAKRVVQRLGKKAVKDLDEKEIVRLAKAREVMIAHKAHLAKKYPNYIKADDSSNELGELYILKKKTLNGSEYTKSTNNQFQSHGNTRKDYRYNDFQLNSKNVGGHIEFVAGGYLKGSVQCFTTQ